MASPETSGQLSVFVSAPVGQNIYLLDQLLSRENIRVVTPSDVARPGERLNDTVRRAIAESSLVLAILWGEGSEGAHVLFELGIAVGLGKPVLASVDDPRSLPAELRDVPVIAGRSTNYDELVSAVLEMVGAPSSTEERSPQPRLRPLGDAVDAIRDALGNDPAERDLVDAIAQALKLSGATSAEAELEGGRGFDLGVWSPDLEAVVGNPFLIDVKTRVRNLGELESSVRQSSNLLRNTRAKWALVVYGEGPADLPSSFAAESRVLVSDLESLWQGLREGSFADFVRALRNQAVHGAPR